MDSTLPKHTSISSRMQRWFRVLHTRSLDTTAMGMLFAAGALFLVGLLVLGFQALVWFEHGTWQPVTVIAAVYDFLPATFLHWVFDPNEWVGLAKAVEHVLFWSVWWVLMLLAIAILNGALAVDKASYRRQLRYYHLEQNKLRSGESQR